VEAEAQRRIDADYGEAPDDPGRIASNASSAHPQDGPLQLGRSAIAAVGAFRYLLDQDQSGGPGFRAPHPDLFLFGTADHTGCSTAGQLDRPAVLATANPRRAATCSRRP